MSLPKNGLTATKPQSHHEANISISVDRTDTVNDLYGLGELNYDAKLYDEAIKDCDYLIPQKTPEGYKNTYWSYAVKYAKKDVSWTGSERGNGKNGKPFTKV